MKSPPKPPASEARRWSLTFQRASEALFTKGRGTADILLAARQLQEKCHEQNRTLNRDLYITFVDLTKALDNVRREGLWKKMRKFGCPDRFITMVRQFHDGMLARVQDNGDFRGIPGHQRCQARLYPCPHIVQHDVHSVLMDAFCNADGNGISIRYRANGKLFNLCRLQAKTNVKEATVRR